MKQSPFLTAVRLQQSFLTPLEKRALSWLAHRIPPWATSDHLTLLGFAAMLLAGLSYWLAQWNPLALLGAVACLAANWFGDSLDGTLARIRNRQRPRYGFYVDHMIDTFGALSLIGGLGLSGYMDTTIALGLLVAYFMLSIEIYLTTYTRGVFHLSFLRCGPTELRVLLAIGTCVLLVRPSVAIGGEVFRLCDLGGGAAIAAMFLILIGSALRNTRALYNEERLP
ncbi:MAG: CDP-alcohol phosphatidyltransferase family protein [Acidobacteria bacterium]|nr:CDP-alcohol phosphatidyltransferase family protein [Acidobacteriota bacterium]